MIKNSLTMLLLTPCCIFLRSCLKIEKKYKKMKTSASKKFQTVEISNKITEMCHEYPDLTSSHWRQYNWVQIYIFHS